MLRSDYPDQVCSIAKALEVVGERWTLLIVRDVMLGNRRFGVSSNLRHLCAVCIPARPDFLRYEWKTEWWNLAFALGILLGGVLGGVLLKDPDPFVLAAATRADLAALGVTDTTQVLPPQVFSWAGLATPPGLIIIVVGSFLVGFGSRWAGGCTSGHAITGLASFRLVSLLAVLGFFAGGLVSTHVLLPLILGGAP